LSQGDCLNIPRSAVSSTLNGEEDFLKRSVFNLKGESSPQVQITSPMKSSSLTLNLKSQEQESASKTFVKKPTPVNSSTKVASKALHVKPEVSEFEGNQINKKPTGSTRVESDDFCDDDLLDEDELEIKINKVPDTVVVTIINNFFETLVRS